MKFGIRNLHGFYRAPDTGGAGGGAGGQTETKTDDGTGSTETNAGTVTFTPEQQAHIDKLIGDRLTRAKSKWETDVAEAKKKADAEAAEAKRKADAEAEAKRLKEQAEWQKLAESHEGRVKDLEPKLTALEAQHQALETQNKAYAEAIQTLLDARIKALGDKAKKAIEGLPGNLDALAKLNWLNANEALFAPEPHPGSVPRKGTPRPGQAGTETPTRRSTVRL